MSLIVATSRIDENTNAGDPSSFKNFFRSPIEVEPDSEIAVQSVKIQRTGNITIEEDDFFCHYFGQDPTIVGESTTISGYDRLLSLSRKISPKRGTYSLSGYATKIQSALNDQYDDPRTFGGYLATIHTNSSGVEKGFDIKCVDKGLIATDITASLTAQPTYNIAEPVYEVDDTIRPSNAFTWTSASGIFERDTSASATHTSVAVLKGAPFGLNDGEFIVEVKNASANPYCVGLTRPQLQIESYANSQISASDSALKRQAGITQMFGRKYYTGVMTYDGNGEIDRQGDEMYDYVFMLDNDDNITIAERVYSPPEYPDKHEPLDFAGSGDFRLQELEYWSNAFPGTTGAKLTKAEFHASWDGISFTGRGDEMELYFKQNGKAVYDKVISSTYSETAGRSFNPIGSTTYALYPQLDIVSGSMTVNKYQSCNAVNSYAYPTFTTGATGGYSPGDDMFSNERFFGAKELPWIRITRDLSSNSIDNVIYVADSSYYKEKHENIEGNYPFSNVNSAGGVDYNHIFTINHFTEGNVLDTTVGSQSFPNMAGKLGFADRAFLDSDSAEGYVSGDDTLTITFTSTGELQKTAISSFIRIPNLTHKSFNGAQSGLSKIIYQLPQFSNDGRQFGPLHFEASEKTYVKLHNPSSMVLNQLDIQIVDSQEKELDSLTGDTQIVFHIRKSK